jgi:ribonuclease P protein component
MKPLGFPKNERLCSKKSIEKIFSDGKSCFSYPIKAAYIIQAPTDSVASVQALFVVPKRKFKRAVKRNAIRRKLREAYRLNKQILHNWCLANNIQLRVAFIYIASEEVDFGVHEKAIMGIFDQLMSINLDQ